MDEVTLVQLWSAAKQGDEAAINSLYMIALQGLPRIQGRSDNSSYEVVTEAAWKVLKENTTKDGERWVTDKGEITLSKFRKKVIAAVQGQCSEKTIDRYLKNPEDMHPALHLYEMTYGVTKSD